MTIFASNESFYEAVTTDPKSISILQWKALTDFHNHFLIFAATQMQKALVGNVCVSCQGKKLVDEQDKPKFLNLGTFIIDFCTEEQMVLVCQTIGRDALMASDPWTLTQLHERKNPWSVIFNFRRIKFYDKKNLNWEEFKSQEDLKYKEYEEKFKRLSDTDPSRLSSKDRHWLKMEQQNKRSEEKRKQQSAVK